MGQRTDPDTTDNRQSGASQIQRAPDQRVLSRLLLVLGLSLAVLVLAALGIFYAWHQGYYFYTTDDATVSGQIVPLGPVAPGTITSVYHGLDTVVHQGDVIATVSGPSGSSTHITSPINGTIVDESARVGATVAPGQPIAQVVNLSALTITAYVEEDHIGDIKTSLGVDVAINAFKDTQFHGTVTRILPVAASALSPIPSTDYANGNFTRVIQRIPVQITLDSYQSRMPFPGESAQVTIHLHT